MGFSVLLTWLTPYYLGLMLGNHVFKDWNLRSTGTNKVLYLWLVVFLIQLAEGYAWYSVGNYNLATTQERLSNCLYVIPCLLLACKYIEDDTIELKNIKINKFLVILGDYSFGVFLIHAFVIIFFRRIPLFKNFGFPISSLLVIIFSIICLFCARKLFGEKYGQLIGLY